MIDNLDPDHLEALRNEIQQVLNDYVRLSSEESYLSDERKFHYLCYNDDAPVYKELDSIFALSKEVKKLTLTLAIEAIDLRDIYHESIWANPDYYKNTDWVSLLDEFKEKWSKLQRGITKCGLFFGYWRTSYPPHLAEWYEESIK